MFGLKIYYIDNKQHWTKTGTFRNKMSAMEKQALKNKLGGLPPMPPPGVGWIHI